MVVQRGFGWAFEHQCTINHKRVEGPYTTENAAKKALEEHKETCRGT